MSEDQAQSDDPSPSAVARDEPAKGVEVEEAEDLGLVDGAGEAVVREDRSQIDERAVDGVTGIAFRTVTSSVAGVPRCGRSPAGDRDVRVTWSR